MSNRLLLAALGATPFLLLLPAIGRAAERDATLTGDRLAIESACLRHVEIQPDPALQGRIVVHAAADHREELDRLVLEQQDGGRVRDSPGECWRPAGASAARPTIMLSIRTPMRMPVSIDAPGQASYVIGDTGGPLRLEMSGTTTLAAGSIGALQAELSGDGRVDIARIDGDARIELSGTGQVGVERGQIGIASLEVSGEGGIRIGATIGNATASVSGSGTIALARVTGVLSHSVSGSGSVTVAPPVAP